MERCFPTCPHLILNLELVYAYPLADMAAMVYIQHGTSFWTFHFTPSYEVRWPKRYFKNRDTGSSTWHCSPWRTVCQNSHSNYPFSFHPIWKLLQLLPSRDETISPSHESRLWHLSQQNATENVLCLMWPQRSVLTLNFYSWSEMEGSRRCASWWASLLPSTPPVSVCPQHSHISQSTSFFVKKPFSGSLSHSK